MADPQRDQEFVRDEYRRLQETVERFDEKALTIKAWSISFSLAGVAAAFVEEIPLLLLVSGIASGLFWVTEALWKQFQQAYYPRIKEIEAWMAGDEVAHPTSPRIATSWSEAWKGGRRSDFRLLYVMFWPHVSLPHAVVAVGGVLGWLANLAWPFVG